MKAIRLLAVALALVLNLGSIASATVTLPQVNNAGGAKVPAQGAVLIGSDGNEIGNAASPVQMATVRGIGYLDTTTVLAGAATYTGVDRPTTTVTFATKFKARVITDQTGTLYIDQSVDGGSTYRVVSTTAVTAGTAANASVDITGPYSASTVFRVRYVNGATPQTYINLTSAFAAA
ncbi:MULTISPECIES: hypothetical protein [unclassified Novosphingobium]|uniref:hypothetical protein n=1 Tax=unclassified Novosphingobium TaxID=2644732 RepID=UPI00086D7982|nr:MULTISPECIES: hypothetical protein [unclassified Novosphingobium]MBN9143770.1 hypothetical protein [Novosphingobium sp.]ODU84378.1 MAG: hypothetical protein ABT10_03065 [Novosphingobium sp. SCN 63-17]OJX92918.1 MAG: hypothetical protein BGP00_23665 [Novosphingobium sp. 63-713]